MNVWSDALALARKDLLVEVRSRHALASSLALAGIALLVVGLAVGPDPDRLRALAPALVWTTLLYAAIAVAERLDRIDRADDAAAGLWLVLEDRRSMFLGRVMSLATLLGLLQLAIWAGATVLLDVSLTLEAAALVPLAALTAVAAASATALVQPLVADTNHRPLLLPVALLPLLVPTLLAGVQAGSALLGGQLAGATGWLIALLVEAALFLGLGLLAFETAASPE